MPALTSGTWAADNAVGSLVLVETSGTFALGENLTVATVVSAVAVGPADLEGVADYDTYLEYAGIAQDHCRASIGKPTGSGAIRGVAVFDGEVYCWRDNAGATAAGMWKASPSGWQAVAMPRLLRFTAGIIEIADGDTIVGATSGVTATAHRVVRKSGSWGSDAAGYIVLSAPSGTFASEQIKVGAATVATVTPDTAVTLPAGGRYMTIEHNFYGAANRKALYGVNGAGLAFEFMDGLLTPIETGTVPDVPTRIFEIANHLGLTFAGGSVQLSAPGEPLIFDVVQGAAELGFGTEITDVTQSNESAVAIYGRSKIAMLTGRDSETFTLQELTEEAGALPWTAQRIARTIYMDGRGLRDLSATQAFGNFRAGSVLPELAAFFLARQKSGATPVLSYICKSKSQYRVLWDDGVGLCVHMGRKSPEAMQFSVDPLRFTCAATGELADGEAMFAGGEDGFVYRIDSGTSLDGEPISGFVLTPFNHLGAPLMDKRLHKTTLELDGAASAHIGITAIFDYGAFGQPYAVLDEVLVDAGGGLGIPPSGTNSTGPRSFAGAANSTRTGSARTSRSSSPARAGSRAVAHHPSLQPSLVAEETPAMSFYIPALFNPRTLARAEDLNSEFAKVSQAIDAVTDVQWVGFARVPRHLCRGAERHRGGPVFLSNATGTLRTYRRISASPGYEDMGDSAVPLTADSLATLTDKTINFGNNSIQMTLAQLNAAISDGDVVAVATIASVLGALGIHIVNGRLGIGTDTPGAELEVEDTSGDNDVRVNLRPNNTTLSQLGASDTITFIDSAGSRPFVLYINGAERFRATSTGILIPGVIESSAGGFKFPDGTTQLTAAGGGGWTEIATIATTSGSSITFSLHPERLLGPSARVRGRE